MENYECETWSSSSDYIWQLGVNVPSWEWDLFKTHKLICGK